MKPLEVSQVILDLDRLVAVIMAGGGGTRFWPRSRKSLPKQFLSFDGKASLLSNTVARLDGLIPPERTYVITGSEHVTLACTHAPHLPKSNIIGEPVGKDTGACVGLATLIAQSVRPDAIVVILAADHLIETTEQFQGAIRRSAELASASGSIVTMGVRPDRPSTGYGYIETGERVDDGVPTAYRVVGFREKPNQETARRFLLDGCYLWNSGNLVFQVGVMRKALEKFLPDIYNKLSALKDPCSAEELQAVYPRLRRISIDLGLLEHCTDRLVIEPSIDWDDLGTIEAVARHVPLQDHGNRCRGEVLVLEGKNNLVDNDTDGLVVISGVDNLLVVRTADALLIMPRKNAESVKEVVKDIERHGFGNRL
jgi:mannose-1-phosphate guanylyltransferase